MSTCKSCESDDCCAPAAFGLCALLLGVIFASGVIGALITHWLWPVAR